MRHENYTTADRLGPTYIITSEVQYALDLLAHNKSIGMRGKLPLSVRDNGGNFDPNSNTQKVRATLMANPNSTSPQIQALTELTGAQINHGLATIRHYDKDGYVEVVMRSAEGVDRQMAHYTYITGEKPCG